MRAEGRTNVQHLRRRFEGGSAVGADTHHARDGGNDAVGRVGILQTPRGRARPRGPPHPAPSDPCTLSPSTCATPRSPPDAVAFGLRELRPHPRHRRGRRRQQRRQPDDPGRDDGRGVHRLQHGRPGAPAVRRPAQDPHRRQDHARPRRRRRLDDRRARGRRGPRQDRPRARGLGHGVHHLRPRRRHGLRRRAGRGRDRQGAGRAHHRASSPSRSASRAPSAGSSPRRRPRSSRPRSTP